MAKLHELLAAEVSVAGAYNVIATETDKVLSKPDMFTKVVTTVKHFDGADAHLDTSETKDATTSVDERIAYHLGRSFQSYFDLLASKDATNQLAKADVELDGKVFLTGVPATFLLTLESKIAELRKKFEAIPTLQPGVVWNEDATTNTFRSDPATTFKTQKSFSVISLAKATEKHAEQVEKVPVDKPVAKIERTTWSGMWTSTKKSETLARLDALLVAFKQARQRANCQEVVKVDVDKKIADFIRG